MSSGPGTAGSGDVPEAFRRALDAIRSVQVRPEIDLEETPAPQRLAPHAVALSADVVAPDDTELGTGRFVLLHDPAGHETWQGTFRVVTFVRASLEPELAGDPLVPSVGWSWLLEALDAHAVSYTAASGTVTRVVSEPFGAIAERLASAELEVRASWTAPDSRIGPHLEAWADLLATVCGLPPTVPGVVATLAHRGGPRRGR